LKLRTGSVLEEFVDDFLTKPHPRPAQRKSPQLLEIVIPANRLLLPKDFPKIVAGPLLPVALIHVDRSYPRSSLSRISYLLSARYQAV
jgi:hypothetical protein